MSSPYLVVLWWELCCAGCCYGLWLAGELMELGWFSCQNAKIQPKVTVLSENLKFYLLLQYVTSVLWDSVLYQELGLSLIIH